MDLKSAIPDIMPHYVAVGHMQFSQSLIAGAIGTGLFIIFVLVYRRYKQKNSYSKFAQTVDLLYGLIYNFFVDIGERNVGPKALIFTTTVFCYVLWNNLIGLLGDMLVIAWPAGHHVFRPITTDIGFNAMLAVTAVIGSVIYGFYKHGFHYTAKYFPVNGMGIVQKVDKRWMVITKFFDILLGLLIGIIELIGEFGRMMSLSLRLFGNMFVGLILLGLLTVATINFVHYPILTPIVVFAYEFCVAILQAFIFSLLTMVYFRLSADHHS